MGPIPSSSSGAPFPVLPLDYTEWNPRVGDSGDDRYKWPEDYRISTGEWFDYCEYPSQELVEELSCWNQIICRFNRFSLRANNGAWGGFLQALDPGHPGFYPLNKPTGNLLNEDFMIRHGLSLIKSKIDSVYINFYGYPAYPWTYGGYTDVYDEDYRIMGIDIMEIRKAIDYAVEGYAEAGIGWSQEVWGNRYTAMPWTPPPYPPIPPGDLWNAIFTCGPAVLPMDGNTYVTSCRNIYANNMVYVYHTTNLSYPAYHEFGMRSTYHLLERVPCLTRLPPATELTEALMRYYITPVVIILPVFAGPRRYVVHQKGADDDKTCEYAPAGPPCAESIWLSPDTYMGEFTIDFSVGPWPRYVDVPIDYSIVDLKNPSHLRPIVAVSEEHVFDRSMPPINPYLPGLFIPQIYVRSGTLILKGF